MREIKFRFWSNHLGKFVVPEDSIFVGALKDPNMNPMQYTGLKDKNGDEIYEGDVVCYWQSDARSKYKSKNKRVVGWREKLNGFPGWNIGVGRNCMNWEIVGNIFENPDIASIPTSNIVHKKPSWWTKIFNLSRLK